MESLDGEGCPDIKVVGAETLFSNRAAESTDREIHQQAHGPDAGRDGDKVGSPIKEQAAGA